MNTRTLGLFALAMLPLTALAQTEVDDGARFQVNLPDISAGSATVANAFTFTTPDDIRSFTTSITGLNGLSRNVDLLVRSGGPFVTSNQTLNGVIGQADYYASGLDAEDEVVVQDSTMPPAPGREWYVAFIIYEGTAGAVGYSLDYSTADPSPALVLLDFSNSDNDPDCDTAPWDDNTAFNPGGGNPATTLGGARRNAMIRAAEILSDEITSEVPIRVRACWESGGGTADEASVAFGRPLGAAPNTPGLEYEDVVYATPAVERRAGTDLCRLFPAEVECGTADVEIRFNVDVDSDNVLGSSRWFYGYDPAARVDADIDFIATALHELSHGIGFTTLVDENGALPRARTDDRELVDIFAYHLADTSDGGTTPLQQLPNDAARAAALRSNGGLSWTGPESSISLLNDLATLDQSYIRMFAPSEYVPGSSVTHVADDYCALMLAGNRPGCENDFRDMGLTRSMLHELGWSPGAVTPPYLGLMFDPARDGHGFEFQLGGFVEGVPIYVMTFYTYETIGSAPEWFQAVGFIENGVFYGLRNGNGDGLPQFTYDTGRSPPQQATDARRGQVVLSFNSVDRATACNDGLNRSRAVAVMQWVIDNEVDEWCMEPIIDESLFPATDFGGLWFAPGDEGWGFSIENIANGDGTTSLFVLVYVYAEDGSPVWFFGFENGFVPGTPLEMELFQRTGFDRLTRSGATSDASAGTLTLTLDTPTANNRVSIDVDYLGIEGGNWSRSDVEITRLSQPRG